MGTFEVRNAWSITGIHQARPEQCLTPPQPTKQPGCFAEAGSSLALVISRLANLIWVKDPITAVHSQRLVTLIEQFGQVLALSPAHRQRLRIGTLLHDLGKISIPKTILLKPGPLTTAEYTRLKNHPLAGAQICSQIPELQEIIPIILHHHERWDGRGYPNGLSSVIIPFDARIVAIVDAFDAMIADRPYRQGLALDEVLTIMRSNSGPQWDPDLLAIFLQMIESQAIAPLYA